MGIDINKPIDKMNAEERREAGRKGGIKSGEVRRQQANMQETLNKMLSLRMRPGKGGNIDAATNAAELAKMNLTVNEAACLKMIEKFLKGDRFAAEWVRDTCGQKPADNTTITMDIPVYNGEEDLQ